MQGTEALICCPDLSSRKVCYLLGTCIQDFVERRPRPNPACQSLLLSHRGTNDTDRGDLDYQCVYRSLGPAFNSMGPQTVFNWILPVRRKGPRRTQQILQVTSCLHSWCLQQGFRFHNHGTFLKAQHLLGRDGIHLSGAILSFPTSWTNW